MNKKIVPQSGVCLKLRNKKRKLLAILWSLLMLSLIAILIMVLLGLDSNTIVSILFPLVVVNFILIFVLRPRISYYNMMYGYQMLLEHGLPPQNNQTKFDYEWVNKIKSKGFNLIKSQGFNIGSQQDYYDIYVRFTKENPKKILSNSYILEFITIIKSPDYDLYSSDLETDYKNIWLENHRKYRLSKQIILQFKKYPQYSDEIKDELDQIICFKESRSCLITINIGYFQKENQIYYLHTNGFAPNQLYHYAVNIIKEIS